ncbi:MAG: metallophosphoesterase [Cyanobacteriota bacterium]|nr:metallophosphoesterase [Cyanobacteriota bacterium]
MKKIQSKLRLLLFLPIIPILLVFWGLLEPYFIDETETVANIPNLPESWEGKKIAQVSDFQIGMWLDNTNTIRRSISKLVEERPAAVLISGDFIYHSLPDASPEINKVLELIRPLTEANIPTYAVLGNHDYSHKPPKAELGQRVEAALEDIGVVVLQNEAVKLELSETNAENPEQKALYLVGIGSRIAERDRVREALEQVPSESPRIAMMHNPQSFEKFPARTAPFAVAGHTHGGQIRLPFSPQWSWLALTHKDEVYVDGWIDDYGEAGNQLYVNRGMGFSDIPIRLNCPPEVTFFVLKSQQS